VIRKAWLAVMLGALVASSAAGAGLDVEAQPAWAGLARAGRWSEVLVRVVSRRGGELALELAGGEVRSLLSTRVEAGEPTLLRLPARPGSAGGLRLVVRGPGGALEERHLSLVRSAPDQKVVAWVGTSARAPGKPPPGQIAAAPDPGTLPVHPRAYETVDALVIDAAALAALETDQLRAFEAHLASCGRVLILGSSAAALAHGRHRAGCGGEFFRASAGGSVEEALRTLLARHPRPLPSPGELAALAAGAHRPNAEGALVAFFTLYAASLLVGGTVLRRPAGLVALPVAASALLLLSFGASRPEVSMSVWSEAASGAGQVRFSALLRVDGMAPGGQVIELPRDADLPELLPSGAGLTLHLPPDDAGRLRAELPTRLLSAEALLVQGSARNTLPLLIEGRGGDARVRNPGREPAGPGYLLRGAQTYLLPRLEPGALFRVGDAQPLLGTELPRWLARAPRRPGEVAVLVPYMPRARSGLSTGVPPLGWLAIRPAEVP
jgi:hypothetical protein